MANAPATPAPSPARAASRASTFVGRLREYPPGPGRHAQKEERGARLNTGSPHHHYYLAAAGLTTAIRRLADADPPAPPTAIRPPHRRDPPDSPTGEMRDSPS